MAVDNMTLLDSFTCSMAWPPLIQSLFAHVPSVSFSNINNQFNNPKSTSIMRWMDLERVAHISRLFEKSTPHRCRAVPASQPRYHVQMAPAQGFGAQRLWGSGRFRGDVARRPGIYLDTLDISRHDTNGQTGKRVYNDLEKHMFFLFGK